MNKMNWEEYENAPNEFLRFEVYSPVTKEKHLIDSLSITLNWVRQHPDTSVYFLPRYFDLDCSTANAIDCCREEWKRILTRVPEKYRPNFIGFDNNDIDYISN